MPVNTSRKSSPKSSTLPSFVKHVAQHQIKGVVWAVPEFTHEASSCHFCIDEAESVRNKSMLCTSEGKKCMQNRTIFIRPDDAQAYIAEVVALKLSSV